MACELAPEDSHAVMEMVLGGRPARPSSAHSTLSMFLMVNRVDFKVAREDIVAAAPAVATFPGNVPAQHAHEVDSLQLCRAPKEHRFGDC